MGTIEQLPERLRERTRALNPRAADLRGEFVVYWMHHAVRGHENPALDVALAVGAALGKPVLVYQGLGGRHRFNNDRHHRFILEGAHDAQAQLAERSIRHVFWLPRRDDERSPLHALLTRAAALVCEDYPAPPFPRWTARWAAQANCMTLAVDAACIAPRSTCQTRPDRAFVFRSAMQRHWAERVSNAWPELPLPASTALAALDPGFEPFDLNSDIDAAIAGCAIDHAVAPTVHTSGGSRMGYQRWDAFKAHGLAGYAAQRNDPTLAWPSGVSRLSPYLHHGHISPLRIAREATAIAGAGPAKFLDELLTWREIAFHWCHHTMHPERLAALPDWAQQTLREHARDARPTVYSLGEMARATTHSALWNAAQDSLRVHGELHNNLRMTWGKAIIGWQQDPQAALDVLVELNHRYALDGSDPGSYGGLLWCMGLFDRPFQPEQTVLGRVRPRDPENHVRRLDLAAYRRIVDRPAGTRRLRIAVVGAGIAGAAAARALHDQGHEVVVYEKSRGVGGRMATRRADGAQWDHGAQYFVARDPRFQRAVADWRARGLVAVWNTRVANLRSGDFTLGADDGERLVGVPGMNALARDALDGIPIRSGMRIGSLVRNQSGWDLLDENLMVAGNSDVVLVAVPPQQVLPLVAHSESLQRLASAARMQPCWTVLVRLAAPLALPFDAAWVANSPLAWIARDDAKPGRAASGLHWVLQAGTDWSQAQRESEPALVCTRLIDAWRVALGAAEAQIADADAHRWLYAFAEPAGAVEYAFDRENGLGLAGDWLRGARVEDAWLSGTALAGAVLRAVARG